MQQSIDSSLKHLGVPRIDSYILHSPSGAYGIAKADWETWRAMEAAVYDGQVGLPGVSNISFEQFATLIESVKIVAAFVQNRCFAHNRWDAEVRALCERHDIIYQGFSLLTANRQVLLSPRLIGIARRQGKTIPQVVFRFAIQLGMLPLTGTTDSFPQLRPCGENRPGAWPSWTLRAPGHEGTRCWYAATRATTHDHR